MKKKIRYSFFFLLISFIFTAGCSHDDNVREKLVIVHAGSLSIPFKEVAKKFTAENPAIEVNLEAYGSRTAARQVSDLKREIDIVASADSGVIRNLLYPEYAGFCIDFTTNRMVIAGTPKSWFIDRINGENWFSILLKKDVEFGYSNPDSDPCGYRSVLTMKLAEIHYGKKGLAEQMLNKVDKRNIRPKEVDLLALLEAGEIDYIFIYKSVATQHGLKIVDLPAEVDLGSSRHEDLYKKVSMEVSGKIPGETILKTGKPMIYGLTIPFNSPHSQNAVKFINFLFGKIGADIMKRSGQPLLTNPEADNLENLPKGISVFNKR